MSTFANEGDMAAALASAAQADAAPSAPAPAPVEQAPPSAPDVPNPVDPQGAAPEGDSFTNIDPSTLPPELQALAKQLQGDYTRKTQEVAPWRKTAEEIGLSADEAREALQFVQQLNDPEVQRELYARLSEQFEAGDADLEDPDVDPRDRQIQELGSRIEKFERQQALNAAKAELAEMESSIKAQYPDFKDPDMERIRRLGLSYQGDLKKAASEYSAWKQSVLGDYVNGKASSTDSLPATPAPGGHSQTPTRFDNLEDATKAALARFANDF